MFVEEINTVKEALKAYQEKEGEWVRERDEISGLNDRLSGEIKALERHRDVMNEDVRTAVNNMRKAEDERHRAENERVEMARETETYRIGECREREEGRRRCREMEVEVRGGKDRSDDLTTQFAVPLSC